MSWEVCPTSVTSSDTHLILHSSSWLRHPSLDFDPQVERWLCSARESVFPSIPSILSTVTSRVDVQHPFHSKQFLGFEWHPPGQWPCDVVFGGDHLLLWQLVEQKHGQHNPWKNWASDDGSNNHHRSRRGLHQESTSLVLRARTFPLTPFLSLERYLCFYSCTILVHTHRRLCVLRSLESE